MAFNASGSVEVPLSLFGGLVTEMSPSDLPEGVSPGCQDVVFVPGKVSSRPGLQRVFVTPLSGSPTVAYAKSCVLPNGNIRNLYLDANGAMWTENPVAAPGVASFLFATTPGSFAKSITGFGREYIAISDGLHGADVPLQWDGTNLDRVTQDGPGAPPTVSSFALPSLAMAVTGVPPVLTITECDPANRQPSGYYTAINVFTSGSLGTLAVGNIVTIAGSSSSFNGKWAVTAVFNAPSNSLFIVSAFLPPGTVTATGGTATVGAGVTMTRAGNLVTVQTTGNHWMKPGNQAQITGVPAAIVGGAISTVVIKNEDSPGVATVTTSSNHGLVPGTSVTLDGITSTGVGGAITAAKRTGGVVAITTTTAHGLTPGASVTIGGVTDATFNTTAAVLSVVSDTVFTFAQTTADAASSGGTVQLNWPIPTSPTPRYFEILSAPTPNTFQVQISYSNGSWTGGTVSYAWDGTFYVSAVPTPTSFQYKQPGPDSSATAIGTVTPFGQVAPGQHQLQVLFVTRQGYVTRPSPPVSFTANGGQYISVSNIPIGPPNVVSRILAFTGAQGAYFYYIPAAPQVNGQTVGTSTVVADNTSTTAFLDFSDNTLYAALGISIPGNNLANQIVLDGALGFGFYASRLFTYGQRNRVQNFLNLGFDGGYLPSSPTLPTGWFALDTAGSIAPGHYGGGWQISVSPGANRGVLFQNAYADAYGAPILHANTLYRVRCWAKISAPAPDVNLVVNLTSQSLSYGVAVTFTGASLSTTGGWLEGTMQGPTPVTVPSDLNLNVYANSTTSTVTLVVDEISVIYDDTPYLDTVAFGSYVNNPEGFDGVSGKFGPADDTRKLLDFGIIRDNLYMLTQEPSGRIHETTNNGVTEPSGWNVSEIGANCGLLSAFSMARSQADDSTASGGEEWLVWASSSGARIFGGDQPWKISQEIQPDWDSINPAALKTVWALNDPVSRVIYFGLPLGTATAPNKVYTLSVRELDTPYQISSSPPVHTSFSGKLLSTDNVRKWAPWSLPLNGAALMYRNASEVSFVGFGGNGGSGPSYGNCYTLNPALLTDQDYGQINPYYTTYFFVNHDAEMALQLGAHRKMLAYLMAYVYGTGNLVITPLVNTPANAWPVVCTRPLPLNPPDFDMEWGGGSVVGQRIAFKIQSVPVTGTDNGFTLEKMVAVMRPASRLPVRGSSR